MSSIEGEQWRRRPPTPTMSCEITAEPQKKKQKNATTTTTTTTTATTIHE